MDNDKIVSTPGLGYIPHPGGLGCTLYEKMWEHQEKLAQIDSSTGAHEYYWSLLQRCARTGIQMKLSGISREDTVLICCNNTNVCVPLVAALFITAIPVVCTSSLSMKNIIFVLKEVKPKVIYTDVEMIETMQSAVEESRMDTKIKALDISHSQSYTSVDDESTFRPLPTTNLKETALIVFDSLLPLKGVCLNHYGLINSSYNLGYLLPTKRILSTLPCNHISSVCSLIAAILYGSCYITLNRFCPNNIWNIIDLYQPNLLFLDQYQALEISKRSSTANTLKLRNIIMLGSDLKENEINSCQKLFPEASILVSYEQTELSGVISFFTPHVLKEMEQLEAKPISNGKVLPGYSIKIVDIETEELLGPHDYGELRVMSKYLMNGYHNNESHDGFDSRGWFKTGKFAYYDQDSCIYVKSDIKDKFNTSRMPLQYLEDVNGGKISQNQHEYSSSRCFIVKGKQNGQNSQTISNTVEHKIQNCDTKLKTENKECL